MSGKPYNPRGQFKPKVNATTQLAPAEIVQAYKPLPPEGQMKVVPIPKEGPKVLASVAAKAASAAPKPKAAPAAKPPKILAAAPELTERESYVPLGPFRAKIDALEEDNPEFKDYEEAQQKFEESNPYHTETTIYMPPTRLAFNRFIYNTYRKVFTLPVPSEPDPEACKALFAGSSQGVEAFLYQKFVREYIRQASPYRGLLVYHGLGSGKTCSAIAAAEALYGIADKKIIVMTPGSLRGNFINEISFCGFKHYQLNNHWVGYEIEPKSPVLLYMISVMSLSRDYVKKVLARPEESRRVLWLPDFSKGPEEYNYKSLPSQDQSDIRAQVNEMINNRFTFITYNGVSKAQLLEWACTRDEDGNGMFDNKVIIIDEIHNFVRNIQGKIFKYLVARPDKRRIYQPEPITVDTWKPAHCGADGAAAYNRAILLYRLVAEARNSKVIGLSGTPIINFPEELGILSNLLAGYMHCAEFMIKSTDVEIIKKFNAIADADVRVDIIRHSVEKSGTKYLLSIFPESYSKVFDAKGAFQGIQDDAEALEDIKTVFARIRTAAAAAGIPIDEEATYKAYPRLPVDEDTFRGATATRVVEGVVKSAKQAAAEAARPRLAGVFVDPMTLQLRNKLVLKKRLTGLISYYKGSKEEYMPRIIRDEVLRCDMSNYMLEKYTAARDAEMKEEVRKGAKGSDPFAGVEVFSKKDVPASYRFRSRATCNFAFPKSIVRPFPEDEDIATEEIAEVDDDAVDAEKAEEDLAAEASVAEEEESVVEPEEEEEEAAGAAGAAGAAAGVASKAWDAATTGAAAVRDAASAAVGVQKKSYQQLLAEAMAALRAQKDIYLKLRGATEESSLRTYSPKLAEILTRLERIAGSHLVYSQFKTVEGLGVLGIALEANGYKEIRVEWTYSGPRLSKESEATILEGPMAAKRYITFTGSGSREERNIILNIFNGNFDKLPESIVSVFKKAKKVNGKSYFDTRNLNGEICKVIGITGAGAEGISLKCVRAVHILEPYWNMVRLDQVKGRAVRICSHADLPVDQRTVEIFTYLSVFSAKQLKGGDGPRVDLTLQTKDKNQTSDEKVYDVCVRKDNVNKSLLKVMKEVAVDCELNRNDNEPDIQCSTIDGLATQYMFDPDLETDILMTASQFREEKQVMKEIVAPAAAVAAATGSTAVVAAEGPSYPVFTIGDTAYIFVPVEGSVNEFTLYESTDTRLSSPIGRVRQNPRTGRYTKVPGTWAVAVAAAAPAAPVASAASAASEATSASSEESEESNASSTSSEESEESNTSSTSSEESSASSNSNNENSNEENE